MKHFFYLLVTDRSFLVSAVRLINCTKMLCVKKTRKKEPKFVIELVLIQNNFQVKIEKLKAKTS